MPLNKLYDVYTFDTSAFYTERELFLDRKLNKARNILSKIKLNYCKYDMGNLKHKKSNTQSQSVLCINCGNSFVVSGEEIDYFNKKHIKFPTRCETCGRELYEKHVKILNSIISSSKNQLKNEMLENIHKTRTVMSDRLIDKNIVSIFDSYLTRSLGMSEDCLNTELVIVKVYYFPIAESIVTNGFIMSGEKYVFFSASAGQIRTKKFVAVKEASLNKCWNNLTCGLSLERINEAGGINRNKYLAYLSLVSSATDEIEFDIDKSIVVDDFETIVHGQVDFIDNNTFEINRRLMGVPITHTDGVGIINHGNKNFMFRAPWIKGLLSPFRFHDFIKKHCEGGDCIVRDIWGKEYKIIEDDIQVIFTKSQMKMNKYYKDWQEYKDNYKKYNCSAGVCNEEDAFPDATLTYQMLQTLTDVSEEELQYICKPTKNKIHRLSSDIQTMLKVFGATKYNNNKNEFQKCLEIYPELLQDIYCKETLRSIKNKLEREAWAGKLDVYGKYTFVIPDLYAFCEHLFLRKVRPEGVLNDGEVYCKLFRNSEKIDCLRSPHLERSHGIRNNVIKSKDERLKWFITNGIYTSCHDLISKLLQFDCDGDMLLVVGEKRFVEVAERNMMDTVPLYYEMGKAEPQLLDSKVLYDGMILAYIHGNIGVPSNEISKYWNDDDVDVDAIKILSAMVNYTIDYSKTLFKPELPKEINKRIHRLSRKKLPYFFVYAKAKDECNVEKINESIVNRIRKYIPRTNLKFNTASLGAFNHKILMHKNYVDKDEIYIMVVDKYRELSKNINIFINVEDNKKNNYNYLFRSIRQELLGICSDKYLLVDILIDYLFNVKSSKHKIVFWNCFGDVVFENLSNNMIDDYVYCSKCGKRFYKEHFNEVLCDKCKSYTPVVKKSLVCIDCKTEFEVSSKANKKIRCDACQLQFKKSYDRKRKLSASPK